MEQAIKVMFLDSGREPKCAPNPYFPEGQNIDLSLGASKTCAVELPYPAPRCGVMLAKCGKCGLSVGLTVAGRVDDPRTVKLGCKLN